MKLSTSIFLAMAVMSCVVQPAPVGPVPVGPPGTAGGPVQAGCTMSGNELRGHAPGMTYLINCPANCASTGRTIWGSGPYTADSALCVAAAHAGAIADAQGGTFQVVFDQGQPAYRGSVQNNVNSSDYGSYGESYWVRLENGAGPVAGPVAPMSAPQIAQIGCTFVANQLRNHAPGMNYRVECPAGCAATPRTVWGTDTYTADSAVCTAAIHAGVVTGRGGQLTVTIIPGQPAYRGSTRNGVRSSDYGSYGESYALSR